jgi:ABC-2 type transport system permease protein
MTTNDHDIQPLALEKLPRPYTQWIGLYTIVRREVVRMLRIASQVFLPPIITTLLYFLIFGNIIGKRIGSIHGADYAAFIAPGLVMLSVITNAYSNVCTSFFHIRFQKSIEELLVSPLHPPLILLGYTLGGMIRGMIVALLVYTTASFFVAIPLLHVPLTIFIVFLVATLFSLAGFINGMLARNFDDVAFVPTFILSPLTYLGGVFYASSMLSPFWQHVSLFNPVFYMVNALRQAMIGQAAVSLSFALCIIIGLIGALLITSLMLLKKGIGIRD